MGSPSSLGYGYQPFGHSYGGLPFQQGAPYPYLMDVGFGLGDWAEASLWFVIPDWYRDEDGSEGVVPAPLRGFIDAIKPLFNELLRKWRQVPDIWNALKCPEDLLPQLAYNFGITLDVTKDVSRQRSEILNAFQLFVTKGTAQGYSILAGFEDLIAEAIPLWEINSALTGDSPAVFEPYFDEIPMDAIPLDSEYDDIYAIWPYTLHYKDAYRTRLLRLIFYPTDNPSQDFDPDVASRIAANILRYKPIHIDIDRVTWDGLRGSSQTWVAAVNADNAAAGMWSATVTGEMRGSSQTWSATIDTDLVT